MNKPPHMTKSANGVRVAYPLFQAGGGGSTPTFALQARDLRFYACDTAIAVALVRQWHSRLPHAQSGPWRFAFKAEAGGVIYAVALWHNPSARGLPQSWLELRRMACAPDAPKNTASMFLGWMARTLAGHTDRLISYQDTAVHTGTIYKAAGWSVGAVSKARIRDRSKNRAGTNRAYRVDANGLAPAASEKIRWELDLERVNY
jgi:hypothetical protein